LADPSACRECISAQLGRISNSETKKQVKNCWEMQQYDCHGEKQQQQQKKKQPPHKKIKGLQTLWYFLIFAK
jgi:hypothetical protein